MADPREDKPKSVRVNPATWDLSRDRISALTRPLTVQVTIHPGDTRNRAVEALVRAVIEATEPKT
jgi:hypothetical protein